MGIWAKGAVSGTEQRPPGIKYHHLGGSYPINSSVLSNLTIIFNDCVLSYYIDKLRFIEADNIFNCRIFQ